MGEDLSKFLPASDGKKGNVCLYHYIYLLVVALNFREKYLTGLNMKSSLRDLSRLKNCVVCSLYNLIKYPSCFAYWTCEKLTIIRRSLCLALCGFFSGVVYKRQYPQSSIVERGSSFQTAQMLSGEQPVLREEQMKKCRPYSDAVTLKVSTQSVNFPCCYFLFGCQENNIDYKNVCYHWRCLLTYIINH